MKRAGRDVKWFSLEHEADFWLERETGQLKQGDEDLIATQDIPLQGLHNAANVMAAVALCEAIGLPRNELLEHVKTFQGLPHRVEKIGEKNGVVFIDDSKGTNVGATAAAIAGLQNPLFVILGDLDGCGLNMTDCATLEEAVQTAYAQAEAGDIVLLSPACASFDMFKGYAHRSEVFIEAFKAL